jgi:hypothetical protein
MRSKDEWLRYSRTPLAGRWTISECHIAVCDRFIPIAKATFQVAPGAPIREPKCQNSSFLTFHPLLIFLFTYTNYCRISEWFVHGFSGAFLNVMPGR